MDYVAELKQLWADLDHYDPIELPHPECVAWVKKWVEKKRVLQFLRGKTQVLKEDVLHYSIKLIFLVLKKLLLLWHRKRQG